MDTLSNVLSDIASYINQDSTLPTGTDLDMWTNLVNQSQNEWAGSYLWRRQLTRTLSVPVQASMTSVGLPANFERLLSPLMRWENGINEDNKYYEVMPLDRFNKASTDKYVYKMGDKASGQYLMINPCLTSGASVTLDYLSSPSSLVTVTDTITCPSRQFLALRTISKILSARSDPRFPQVKADSDDLYDQLKNDEAAATGGQDNQTPTNFGRKGLRIGQF